MKKIYLFALALMLLLTACGKQTTGADVVASFKAAGLEAENPSAMTKDDFKLAPYVCQATHFYIPSLDEISGAGAGGRIFICDNSKDRDLITSYYTELGRSSAMLFSWVFTKDNVVIQINGDLSEEKARLYEAAIP